MTYYHATTRDRIASIKRFGLCSHGQKAFEWCETGVYLASEAGLAVGFLMERALAGEFDGILPSKAVDSFCVIVIDSSRVEENLLRQDPNIQQSGFWIYPRAIDVNAMPIISAEEALDGGFIVFDEI